MTLFEGKTHTLLLLKLITNNHTSKRRLQASNQSKNYGNLMRKQRVITHTPEAVRQPLLY